MKDPVEVTTYQRLYNILLLSAGWCLAASCLFIQVSLVTLAAADIAGNAAATVPIAVFNVAAALTVMPGTLLMRRYGRQVVFPGAAALALVGSSLQLLGLYHGGYALLVIGSIVQGLSFSQANNYRFVAAEFSTPEWRPRAISLVVFGGVLAAGIGPEISRRLRFALPMPYAGSFILMCGLHCLHILVTLAIDYKLLHRLASEQQQAAPQQHKVAPQQQQAKGKDSEQQPGDSKSALVLQEEAAGDGSSKGSQAGGVVVQVAEDKVALEEPPLMSYRALLLTHEFIVPALTAGLSFCSMTALMSVTPIAMRDAHRPDDESTWVIEAHIVGMYLPGLFSADLMAFTGPWLLMALGAPIITAGNAILFAGGTMQIFMPAMTLVGVGWNFAYVAASTLITGVYAKEPRRRLQVQGATDTVVLTLTGLAIGSSSSLSEALGWRAFCVLYLVVNIVMVMLTAGYLVHRLVTTRRLK